MTIPYRQGLEDCAWTLRALEGPSDIPAAARSPVTASIPGCVHTDLMAAGLIDDPAAGMNELSQQWIGLTDWEYRCAFDASPELFAADRTDLVCDGLDTIATLELNGIALGRAANMFHPHRFALGGIHGLRKGTNELVIRFTSPISHIREEAQRLGPRPINGDWDPFVFVRKAACNLGWDWAPRVATCGIWKSIRLEARNGPRIESVRPHPRRDGDGWIVEVHVDLDWTGGSGDCRAVVQVGTKPESVASAEVPSGARSTVLKLHAPGVEPWWPRGVAGGPRLYDLGVELFNDGDGTRVSDSWRGRIGFRELELRTVPDAHGTSFTLAVNGREVFCKGFNWIPEGLFPARVSPETTRDRIRRALDANANMLRVWGGGFYESDEFYGLCDELGLLVWQDFMFACAMYPEEPPFPALIEAEARHQIARLSSHPSVALWCGGNECIWAYESWGNAPGETPWKDRLAGRSWGRGYYLDLFPRLVRELDPSRPYWANSPWSGDEAVLSNALDRGDRHTWDSRGEGYRAFTPRFCSEFGHQSPANLATLARVIAPEELHLGSPGLAHRQRATGGTARHIDAPIAELFRLPRTFEEWHFLAQLNQARSLQAGIEWLRTQQPRCMGALVWQLNDAWPGMSWSVIDADGRRKPAYRAVAESFQVRLITIQPDGERPCVYAVNDSDEPWSQKLDLTRLGFGGAILGSARRVPFTAPPRAATRIADLAEHVGPLEHPDRELFVAATYNQRRTWFALPDKELRYPEPRFQFGEIGWARGGGTIRATAGTLIRDLTIGEDAIPGYRITLTSPFRTLLPGENFTLAIGSDHKATDLPAGSLFSPPVLWCANGFGRS
jgi:beta-mannosidase